MCKRYKDISYNAKSDALQAENTQEDDKNDKRDISGFIPLPFYTLELEIHHREIADHQYGDRECQACEYQRIEQGLEC